MKNLNLRAMLLLAALLCCGVSAFADTTMWQDSIEYTLYYDLTAVVTDAEKGIKTANIPEKITYEGKDYTVTSIGRFALNVCRSLVSVVILNSVTSIGEQAFTGCLSLAFAYRLNSDYTAEACYVGSKKTANIPEKITYEGKDYAVTRIGEHALMNCDNLHSVTIGIGVQFIDQKAFNSSI